MRLAAHLKGTTMNPIIALLREAKVTDEQINQVFTAATQNPMMAMVHVQQLGLPAEELQKVVMLVMTDPGLIQEAAQELGLDLTKVAEAKEKLQQSK